MPQVKLVQAAAGAADGELLIETDGDNLGASHIVSGDASGKAIKVPSLRLQRILDEAGVAHVDALKIDVEGFEDRVLTGFFQGSAAIVVAARGRDRASLKGRMAATTASPTWSRAATRCGQDAQQYDAGTRLKNIICAG